MLCCVVVFVYSTSFTGIYWIRKREWGLHHGAQIHRWWLVACLSVEGDGCSCVVLCCVVISASRVREQGIYAYLSIYIGTVPR